MHFERPRAEERGGLGRDPVVERGSTDWLGHCCFQACETEKQARACRAHKCLRTVKTWVGVL